MDSTTSMLGALVAGAAAAGKSTEESTVKDSYQDVKQFLKKKYGNKISTDNLEKNPDSENVRASLKHDLRAAGAADDPELIALLKNLIDVVKKYAPDTKVAEVNIDKVHFEGVPKKSFALVVLVGAAIIVLIIFFFILSRPNSLLEKNTRNDTMQGAQQTNSTSGSQSPIIQSKGDVDINYSSGDPFSNDTSKVKHPKGSDSNSH